MDTPYKKMLTHFDDFKYTSKKVSDNVKHKDLKTRSLRYLYSHIKRIFIS